MNESCSLFIFKLSSRKPYQHQIISCTIRMFYKTKWSRQLRLRSQTKRIQLIYWTTTSIGRPKRFWSLKAIYFFLATSFTGFKLPAITLNNVQQGVQTDATCSIQQWWELLANNVASVCTRRRMRAETEMSFHSKNKLVVCENVVDDNLLKTTRVQIAYCKIIFYCYSDIDHATVAVR